MPSREYSKLCRLDEPTVVRAGDLYRERCGVMLVMGHKRHTRYYKNGHTWIWLYHMGGDSLHAAQKDLRDHDINASQAEKWIDDTRSRGEECVYVGNIFEMAPLDSLGAEVANEIRIWKSTVPRRQGPL